jgi:hypothetical protein
MKQRGFIIGAESRLARGKAQPNLPMTNEPHTPKVQAGTQPPKFCPIPITIVSDDWQDVMVPELDDDEGWAAYYAARMSDWKGGRL